MPGNQFGDKLNDEQKQDAYNQYCDWIGKGNSKEAWYYDSEETSITYKTMESYIKKNPKAFPSEHLEKAKAMSRDHWETIGKKMMLGKYKEKVQPAVYQMFMRNKFSWGQSFRLSDLENSRLLVDIIDYASKKKDEENV